MTSPAHASEKDDEQQFLEGLRKQYEEQGFKFIVDPRPEHLPNFLGNYRPDAIALNPKANIAIEVKRRPGVATERSLQNIRRLFDGHSDWHFTVVYMGSDPLSSIRISASSPAAIRSRLDEVKGLLTQQQRRAAFIMAWSLLEAALNRLDNDAGSRPRTPGTVIQTLAMLGYLDPQLERQMRGLVELRNRIVHGDLDAEPAQRDVELIFAAISKTLEEKAA